MSRSLHILTVAAAGVLAVSVAAVAAAPDYRVGTRWFRSADADKDQRVTREEADAVAIRRFARLDRDGDGTVTAEEIDRFLAERMARQRERMLRRLDADNDRVITRAEIDARTGAMFAEIDGDGDGGISAEEVRSYREKQRERRRARRLQRQQD